MAPVGVSVVGFHPRIKQSQAVEPSYVLWGIWECLCPWKTSSPVLAHR